MAKEEWRDVPGYGGHYKASSLGRIKVKRRVVERMGRHGKLVKYTYRPRLLRRSPNGRGYYTVSLGWDGNQRTVMVHHMVLLAFHGPRPPGFHGCHNNSISTDNRPQNLRWDTRAGNMADRKRMGLYLRGEDHPMAKITNAAAMELRMSNLSVRQAAERYGISKTQAARIKKGQRGGAA